MQTIFDTPTTWITISLFTETGTTIAKQFKYCPNTSVSPKEHCICFDEPVKLQRTESIQVKFDFTNTLLLLNENEMNLFYKMTTIALKPNTISSDALTTHQQRVNTLWSSWYPSHQELSNDKLIYKIDKNFFYSSFEETDSLVTKQLTEVGPDGQSQIWTIKYTGETVTSETKVIKVLDILAQIGALNGVLILVCLFLLKPFLQLKYYENMMNGVNMNRSPTHNKDYSSMVLADEEQPSPIQKIVPQKQQSEEIVRNKQPPMIIHIGFFEWIASSCTGKSRKIKAFKKQGESIDRYFDTSNIIRNNIELTFIKKFLFNNEQLDLLENIPLNIGDQTTGNALEKKATMNEEKDPKIIDLSKSRVVGGRSDPEQHLPG